MVRPLSTSTIRTTSTNEQCSSPIFLNDSAYEQEEGEKNSDSRIQLGLFEFEPGLQLLAWTYQPCSVESVQNICTWLRHVSSNKTEYRNKRSQYQKKKYTLLPQNAISIAEKVHGRKKFFEKNYCLSNTWGLLRLPVILPEDAVVDESCELKITLRKRHKHGSLDFNNREIWRCSLTSSLEKKRESLKTWRRNAERPKLKLKLLYLKELWKSFQ